MALTVALNGTNLTNAENTTGWAKTGLISNPVQETDLVIQGTYAVSSKASSKSGALYYDVQNTLGAGVNLDFSRTGANYGQHIFIWMNCTTLGAISNVATGGLRIWVATDTSNYGEWHIFGSDTLDRYNGGWIRLVIDPHRPPTTTTGTLNLAAVRYVGIYIDATGSSKSENLIIDRIDVAYGLRIYGTDTNGWQDVVDADMNTQANKYGMFQSYNGVYYCNCRLEVGDSVSTNTTDLTDSDRVIRWRTYEYWNGTAWSPMIDDDFYRLDVVSNTTGRTYFDDGIQVGSDVDDLSGRNGSVVLGADLHRLMVTLDDGTRDASSPANRVRLFGTEFNKVYGEILGSDGGFPQDGGKYANVTFERSGQWDPVNGAAQITNCNIQNTSYFPRPLAACIIDQDGIHTNVTQYVNSPAISDVPLAQALDIQDYTYFGAFQKFDKLLLDISNANAQTVTWQYWNGTTWTALTVADESNSFGRAYKSWITWTIPGDWATTVVNTDGRELYYIRAGVANPIINTLAAQGWLYGPPGGAAFKWNEYLTSFDQEGTTINIQKTSFVANSDTTNDPMAIEHTDPGTYLYDELNFSGNDYDIQTNINDEREDYYLFINADSFTQVIKAGQSFTTAGGTLAKVIFQLMRTGSTTTGYVVAKLYTHSGTYGTNSLPIGTPLAESARVDVTTISYVTPQQITFSFADNYYMEPGYYVITVEDDAGVQARVRTYRDSSTPTHSGNASIESSGTWTVLTGSDLVFAIYIGGTPKVVDFYSESNYTTDVQLRLSGASAYTDAGQTYIASGGKLTKATFYLQKVGAPTGTLYAYLYQYDGQIGDGGGGGGTYPTKTILSTSTGISAASISTTYSLVTFDFDAQFQTEPGQVYFIVVGISGGTSDASNYINCGRATLGHAGDLYGKYLTSTWIWFVTTDLIFYVWEGGEVDILSAESALDPSTYIINGDPPGVVNIDNAVYVYLSFVNEAGVAIDDVRVRLETDPGGDLLTQGDTDTASTFLYIYRYSSDQDIRIIVRKKGYKYQNIGATISNIGINLTVVLIRDEVVYLPG